MLTQCRDLAHGWFDPFHSERWNQGAERPDWRFYLPPTATRLQLRMVEEFFYRIQPAVSNLRAFQPNNGFFRREMLQDFLDDFFQGHAVLHSLGVGSKS